MGPVWLVGTSLERVGPVDRVDVSWLGSQSTSRWLERFGLFNEVISYLLSTLNSSLGILGANSFAVSLARQSCLSSRSFQILFIPSCLPGFYGKDIYDENRLLYCRWSGTSRIPWRRLILWCSNMEQIVWSYFGYSENSVWCLLTNWRSESRSWLCRFKCHAEHSIACNTWE